MYSAYVGLLQYFGSSIIFCFLRYRSGCPVKSLLAVLRPALADEIKTWARYPDYNVRHIVGIHRFFLIGGGHLGRHRPEKKLKQCGRSEKNMKGQFLSPNGQKRIFAFFKKWKWPSLLDKRPQRPKSGLDANIFSMGSQLAHSIVKRPLWQPWLRLLRFGARQCCLLSATCACSRGYDATHRVFHPAISVVTA